MNKAVQSGIVCALGDVMLDTNIAHPRVLYNHEQQASCLSRPKDVLSYPFVNTGGSIAWLRSRGHSVDAIHATAHRSSCIRCDDIGLVDHGAPFERIVAILSEADVAFANLECPLSRRGRPTSNDGAYRARPEYATAMAQAGIHLLSFANNHSLDFGEEGFVDTIQALAEAELQVVGAGMDAAAARAGVVRQVGDIKVALIAASMVGRDATFATQFDCGVAVLNDYDTRRAIEQVRLDVDIVILSVHWGRELMRRPPAALRRFAHRLIDYGADVIIGHHSHAPGPIETYGGRPILYSLGNCVFGHGHSYWSRGLIAKLRLGKSSVTGLELIVLDVSGQNSFVPVPLTDRGATEAIDELARLSADFNTRIVERNGRGYVDLSAEPQSRLEGWR